MVAFDRGLQDDNKFVNVHILLRSAWVYMHVSNMAKSLRETG